MTEALLVWLQPGDNLEPASDKLALVKKQNPVLKGESGAERPQEHKLFFNKYLGGKAANLMRLVAAGMPVPAAFCLTTATFRAFLDHHGLELDESPGKLARACQTEPFPPSIAQAVCQGGAKLAAAGQQLAVRSSATIEDQEYASFAGQGDSFLGVRGDTELLAAVGQCWASLWSRRAQNYQVAEGAPAPEMAVIVQQMMPCQVSGIAFSVDPLDGASAVVVEAVAGLGDDLAAGRVDVERYRIERGEPCYDDMGGGLLAAAQLEQIVALALAAEELFGAPQDIEWGFVDSDLFIFQSRPITIRSTGFFTEHLPDDDYWWTGGFFNERFPRPVSPLGWTLLRELLVPLALGDPLRFLGVPTRMIPPLVKLYRGRPYANVAAFQMLYAVFPQAMLPADSYRYFPDGDTSLRRTVSYPRSIAHPRTFLSLAWTFLRQPAGASPWHNWRTWAAFEGRHAATLDALRQEFQALSGPRSPETLWGLHRAAQALNRELLGLHRWSLTLADLTCTLLRRLLAVWRPERDEVETLAAELLTGLPSYSLQLNAALHRLAAGEEELETFLLAFGHRSFDLDIAHPTFADDPAQVTELAERVAAGAWQFDFELRTIQRLTLQRQTEAKFAIWQRPLFRHVLNLAQAYMQLRENQRFVWQKTLAFQRKLFMALGAEWFDRPETVFGATLDEVSAAAVEAEPLPRGRIEARCAELHRLEEEHRQAPQLTYPAFLRGNRPVESARLMDQERFYGLPVSPGVGRGPVRVVLSPEQFSRVQEGDVLVTRGADPGWTPLFGILAGLVLETGGQLSHGAVVAREYGLPAVAAIPNITQRLSDGQVVTLDGRTGLVVVEKKVALAGRTAFEKIAVDLSKENKGRCSGVGEIMSIKTDLLEKIENRTAHIAVIGMGYVGLPLAVEFAQAGFRVTGVDINSHKMKLLNEGNSYIPDVSTDDLAPLVASGQLSGATDFGVLAAADAMSICVPTPLGKSKDPDISYIVAASEQISRYAHTGMLVILESTTYPGTTEEIILPRIIDNGMKVGEDFFLAFSPERVDPGNEVWHTRNTPKVMGGVTPACVKVATALYRYAVDTVVPVSSTQAAEMVKLLENTFRAVNIALVNEVAIMCDKLGVDVWEVIEAAATKPFGFMPFYPGPGVGGHCIPLDPHYLSWKLKTLNYNARFIELAGEINSHMPDYVVSKVVDALNDHVKPVKGSKILILGVAYKPDIDDVRESPALDVIHLLQDRGANVVYHDPCIPTLAHEGLEMESVDLAEVLPTADCVVVVTHHSSYHWQDIANQAKLIVDTRHAFKGIQGSAQIVGL